MRTTCQAFFKNAQCDVFFGFLKHQEKIPFLKKHEIHSFFDALDCCVFVAFGNRWGPTKKMITSFFFVAKIVF